MHFSTTQSKIAAASAAVIITGAGVVGATAVTGNDAPGRDTQPPAMRAPAYQGDPWEKRARDDFAAAQQDLRSGCYVGGDQRAQLQKLGGC